MKKISRRNFFKWSAIASTSFLVPNFLKGFEAGKLAGNKKINYLIVHEIRNCICL